MNRAVHAEHAHAEADFLVGIEGGIHDCEKENGSICVGGGEINRWPGRQGKTGSFFLPTQIARLIREGKELGEAGDIVFRRVNSKQENGAVGILARDAIHGKSLYTDAATFALILF